LALFTTGARIDIPYLTGFVVVVGCAFAVLGGSGIDIGTYNISSGFFLRLGVAENLKSSGIFKSQLYSNCSTSFNLSW